MNKLLFILFILFSVSCQINTNNNGELEKIGLTEKSWVIEKSTISEPKKNKAIRKQSKSNEEVEKIWLTDVSHAIEQSKLSGKPIFAFFTGKEWCTWCKKLERQVLSKDGFINYAKENLVLLELDFPRGGRNLPQKQIELARKFNIKGYPTVILMDSSTNKIAQTGYQAMSPEQYIDHVKSLLID